MGTYVMLRSPDLRAAPESKSPGSASESALPSPKDEEVKGVAAPAMLGTVSGLKGKFNLPPTLNLTPTLRHVVRYACANGVSNALITPANMLNSLGTVCTAANATVFPFVSSFRIHSIRIWNGLSSTGKTQAAVRFSSAISTAVRDVEESVSYPEGVTIPSATEWRPPKGSTSEFWQASAGTAFMAITCGPGSILDIDVSYTLVNSFVGGAVSISTGVVGTVYYLPLDGVSSHAILREGVPTTF